MAEQVRIGPVNEFQTGTTELHIGSIYLTAGLTITTSTTALIGTESGGTAYLRLRRFTGGNLVFLLQTTGTGLSSVTSVNFPTAIANSDYYDLFLSGDSESTISIVKGINLVVE